jgi:hypothetical protein
MLEVQASGRLELVYLCWRSSDGLEVWEEEADESQWI